MSVEGIAEHSAYGEGSAQLAYGLGPDGWLKHISEVEQGLACNCRCPACEARLIARRPKKAVHHFAHHTNKDCEGALESILHILGKEALVTHKRILLPPVEAVLGKHKLTTHEAQEIDLHTAVLEHRLDGVTPDIYATFRDRSIAIEIYVTHACDLEKVARLRKLDLPTVEIDLSRFNRRATREQVAEQVVRAAKRKWLFNSKIDEAEQLLEGQIAEAEMARHRQLDREAAALLKKWRAAIDKPYQDPAKFAQTIQRVTDLGFASLIGIKMIGEKIMGVEPRAWQAFVLNLCIVDRKAGWTLYDEFHEMNVFLDLRRQGLLSDLFDTAYPPELIERARSIQSDFRAPGELLREYLGVLATHSLLEGEHDGWSVTTTARQAIARREQALVASSERTQELDKKLRRILSKVPTADLSTFEFGSWFRNPHPPFSKSPTELAQIGGDDWRQLLSALSEIEDAFLDSETLQTELDLPVSSAIVAAASERAAERERQRRAAALRESEAQQTRENSLLSIARECFGEDADAWLQASAPGHTISRRATARESREALDRLFRELDAEYERREAAAVRRAAKAKAVADFSQKASDRVGPDLMPMYLNNYHPKLKGRPIDLLVDDKSVEFCLSVVPAKRSGGRR